MAGVISDVEESVLKEELTMVLDDHRQTINDSIDMKHVETNAMLQQLNDNIVMLNTHFDRLVNPPNKGHVYPRVAAHEHKVVDDNEMRNHEIFDARRRNQLNFNRQGLRGNNFEQLNAHVNEDPFAKVKFTIPFFAGAYDAEKYLNWEMTVKQKFNDHLVPKGNRVRHATIEFKDFAII